MYSKDKLEVMNWQQLYSAISQLNVYVNQLKSENEFLKIILFNLEKYFKYFDEISETFLSKDILDSRKQINQWIDLNRNRCHVSVDNVVLTENQRKSKSCIDFNVDITNNYTTI